MAKRPGLCTPVHLHDFDPLVCIWLIRMTLHSPVAMKQLCHGIYAEEIRAIVGIKPFEGQLHSALVNGLSNSLLTRANLIEQNQKQSLEVSTLETNIQFISSLLNLDAIHQDVLLFIAIHQHHILFRDVIEQFGAHSPNEFCRLIAAAFNHSVDEIQATFYESDRGLVTIGLVALSMDYHQSCMRYELNADIYKVLFINHSDLHGLMADFIDKASSSTLQQRDFIHLDQETKILESYLTQSNKQQYGVNILIYGPTGSGKTEYAKWLAMHISKNLYQVKAKDGHHLPVSGMGRIAFYQLSQQFLKHANAIIMFDEIEDVFPILESDHMSLNYTSRLGKAWMNTLLETNPIPTLWITNSIAHIDQAYLRRFDFAVEVDIPPLSVRLQILKRYLLPLGISTASIKKYAQHSALSPAQIERAAKVLKAAKIPKHLRESKLDHILESSMRLLNQDTIKSATPMMIESCELSFVNADYDLNELVKQLAKKASANICLHGAPGTGKSTFVHLIAHSLNMPVMIRTAADLLSPYLGETEQNLQDAFKAAQRDGAVLLIDEADSFLRSRDHVAHGWEVTQINQMLSLMESFWGLLICTTNRLDMLDEACMRRFDFKVKFELMTAEQRWRMFKKLLMELTDGEILPFRDAVMNLEGISLGDFATVRKQNALSSKPFSPEKWIARLKVEVEYKASRQKRAIGFISP